MPLHLGLPLQQRQKRVLQVVFHEKRKASHEFSFEVVDHYIFGMTVEADGDTIFHNFSSSGCFFIAMMVSFHRVKNGLHAVVLQFDLHSLIEVLDRLVHVANLEVLMDIHVKACFF